MKSISFRLVALFAAMALSCFILSSCSKTAADKVNSFNGILELIDEYKKLANEYWMLEKGSDTPEAKIIEDRQEILKEQITKDFKRGDYDEAFVTAYLASYSDDELLLSLYKLQEYYSLHDNTLSDCWCYCLNSVIDAFSNQSNNIETITFNKNIKEGYYSNNPNAEPQPFVEEENHGRVQTVEYYGDFAVATLVSEYYDSGAYEWKNGIFHNRYPGWKTKTSTQLWYKGTGFSDEDVKGVENFSVMNYSNVIEKNHYYFKKKEEKHLFDTQPYEYYEIRYGAGD